MRNSLTKYSYSSLLVAVVLLNSACSALDEEGSGRGLSNLINTELDINPANKATISNANAQSLAITGTEGVKIAVESNDSSFFLSAKVINDSPIQQISVYAAQQIAQSPAQAEIPNLCDNSGTGGSVDLDTDIKLLTITNCTTNGFTLNGTASISTSENAAFLISTYVFKNFSISNGSNSSNINLITVCKNNKTEKTLACTYKSESTGIDNRTYRAEISDVSGNKTTGYFVSAIVNDPDNGNINISTETAITLNCSNAQPYSGSIVLSDGTNTLNVTFNDCSSYSVTFNGSTVSYPWP